MNSVRDRDASPVVRRESRGKGRHRIPLLTLLLVFAAWLVLAAPACSTSTSVAASLVAEEACHLNSDCAPGLLCALGACRAMCMTAADCNTADQTGGTCVDNGDVAVCRYADENNTPCSKQADCPAPLACASDYRCRNLCDTSADCNVLGITGRVCAKDAQGVYYCAQPSEVSMGDLVVAPPPGAPTSTLVLEPDGGIGVVRGADAAAPGAIETMVGPIGGALGIGAATLIIPSGALDGEVVISIRPIPAPVSGVFLGSVFDIEPSGTQFKLPVTVTLSYANTNLGGLPSSAFAVSTVVGGAWKALPGLIRDANAQTISGTTTHLSPYALVEQKVTVGGPDASMKGADGAAVDSTVPADSPEGAADTQGTADAGLDVGVTTPASCVPGGQGMTNCGDGTESCCASLEVAGGAYYRTYENLDEDSGVVVGGGGTDSGATGEADPTTVSGFRLDKYDVTVGRFRQFVNAVMPTDAGPAGYVPPSGSGKHTHLNGGLGLLNAGVDSGVTYELGWVAADDTNLAPTNQNLVSCTNPEWATWTNAAAGNENLPINCVNWWESYAFCIWDGGFLPSDAEWEYAAAGGSQQREYPWGSTAPGTACPGTGCQYAIYNCDYPSGTGTCAGMANIAPVGTATLGAGLWGQFDLAGDVFEWNLDWYASYAMCTDCANVTAASYRVNRGGSFINSASNLLPPHRDGDTSTIRDYVVGFRCSRTP